MDICPLFVAYPQTPVLMEPRNRALDNPSCGAQATAMTLVPSCQHWTNPERSKGIRMRLGIIRSVAIQFLRSTSWSTAASLDPGYRVDQRIQLRHIMPVRASDPGSQRNSTAIGQYMVFRASLGSICRVWPGLVPPKTARMLDESMTARDQSILLAPWSFSRRT
jgi:hypothetical protein